MNTQTKWIIGIIIVAVLIWLGFSFSGKDDQVAEDKPIKIGAVLPLSGTTASLGEEVKRGIELAVEDLGQNLNVELLFEDSMGQPAEGVSAYTKLVNTNNVDIVISVFSRVSVPLTELALKNKTPLLMALVAAMDAVKDDNPYAFRVFFTAEQVGNVHFSVYKKMGFDKIALLRLNDEFGVSISETINKKAGKENIVIVEETYLPQDTDYRTQLTKIKAEEPDALIFVGIPPTALSNVLKQSSELELNVPVFEPAGILQSPATRAAVGTLADGVFTIATPFDVKENGQSFHEKYERLFGENPSQNVSFGYDMVKLFLDNTEDGWTDADTFASQVAGLSEFSGLNGTYSANGKGEINPVVFPAQFINGELIRVK